MITKGVSLYTWKDMKSCHCHTATGAYGLTSRRCSTCPRVRSSSAITWGASGCWARNEASGRGWAGVPSDRGRPPTSFVNREILAVSSRFFRSSLIVKSLTPVTRASSRSDRSWFSSSAIRATQRHRAELEGNGYTVLSADQQKGHDVSLKIAPAGLAIYPRRAVLNVAMLLRDSTVRRPGIPRRPGGQCGRFPWWVCGRSDGGVCPGEGGLWRVGGLFRKSLFPRRPAVRPTDI